MTPETLIMQILAGGLLGMLGQGMRAVAGMKKIHDAAAACGQSFSDIFRASQFVVSMVVGFTAGALAMLIAGATGSVASLDRSMIMSIVAAGYAGTDFIEAFLSREMPSAAQAPKAGPARPAPMG